MFWQPEDAAVDGIWKSPLEIFLSAAFMLASLGKVSPRHNCVILCRPMEQTNYSYLLISNVFKDLLNLWTMIIIKKWCLTTDSPQCYWWWMVQSDMHDNLKKSVVDRAFGVPLIISELLFVFLLIHNYHFLCHFNVIFLMLISLHDPERHLLLAQVRGFFIVLICWKSPCANTYLKANKPSDSI